MTTKRDLTSDELETSIRQAREARAAVFRLTDGVAITLPISHADRLCHLGNQIQVGQYWLTCRRENINGEWYHPAPNAHLGPERTTFLWFCRNKPKGRCKRALTREEWVALGEQAKVARSLLVAVGMTVQLGYPRQQSDRWFRLDDALGRKISRLDSECCIQHPGWREATMVFYGSTLAENPALSASVNLEAVEAIVTMGETDAVSRPRRG